MIKNSFKNNTNLNDCLNDVLDRINKDSYEIFDLKISSNDKTNSKLSIIDRNFINVGVKEEKDFFDKLFTFKPMSKGSIVKNYN